MSSPWHIGPLGAALDPSRVGGKAARLGEALAAGLRVIRPDLRGHGRSDRPDSGYHVSHHAADVTEVLDAEALRRAAVIGFSFGGGVALELARRAAGIGS